MALRLHSFIDTESAAEMAVTNAFVGSSKDIFQEAVAASEHDSNGEDPFGPQPKRFMQTEHQKRQNARNLEIRKMAWTIRKMKKIHKENHQRLKRQKQGPSPFEKLPSDLVLKLMQHTNLRNISELIETSAANQKIFNANQNAVFRGIEIEQFPQWRWLFGDSKDRTSAQLQRLKDAILSENYSRDPGSHGWAHHDQLIGILLMIDNGEFTGVRNVMFLQDMQDYLDLDIKATESYTRTTIARRTAMCLRSLSFERAATVKEKNELVVDWRPLPWEARSQLINEQPASIQAEIRSVLEIVVQHFYPRLEEVVTLWIWEHYSTPGNHRKPGEVRRWMSKLVTGLILETVIPQWRCASIDCSPASCFAWESSSDDLADNLADLLNRHNGGSKDALEIVKDGVEFGQRIGLGLEGSLDRGLTGDYLYHFRLVGKGEA